MKHGDWAWMALAAAVLAYEVAAKPNQLLSQRMDVYRSHHPVATHVVIAYIALHLTRRWPTPLDPLHRMAQWLNK